MIVVRFIATDDDNDDDVDDVDLECIGGNDGLDAVCFDKLEDVAEGRTVEDELIAGRGDPTCKSRANR